MTRRHQIRLLLMIGLVSRLTHSGKSGREEVGDNAPQTLELTAFNRTWSDAGEQGARARDWGPQEPRRSSWALAERAPQWPRCCENGGTCVLGSFCVCPAHFTGRHCEHDQRHSDCGALGHGAWTVRGCRLCRCVFGSLHCLRRQTLGRCGKRPQARSSRVCSGSAGVSIPSIFLYQATGK
ncbi:cryptic family protein 1B [Oryctolagus cuniculus]|uniref:cryptic family protein 1B n=1 Tax=Oryctolagus cuniculus TaxID=9986 RepID=UPI003879EE7B